MSSRFNAPLPMLAVPTSLVTTTGRPWLVDVWAAPMWVRVGAVVPALMGTVLLFMDQNITTRLVNQNDWNMLKGPGYHLDMLVLAAVVAAASVFGMPWLVASTVPSIAHLNSLAKRRAGEGGKEVCEGVIEQRVTGFSIHLLMGLAILYCRPLLQQVPISVVMGLFLYLGVTSTAGNQMLDRVKMLFMDPGELPQSEPYVAGEVPLATIHKFTLIQVACLAALWWMKTSPLGIFFPILIAALAPIRIFIGRWFSERELFLLDNEDAHPSLPRAV
mmetsp:Transcript_17549/g.56601  ORF Transcript_17549/g.56601 Transcript_17549/m.56601 type:complete len:274 (-) Transcript_17549:1036-1857(-)